jgi:putative ABC transport system substrate-binding protein
MPSRRAFIQGSVAVLAARGGAALAQDRIHRIGIVDPVPAAANTENLAQFQKGMRELGYVEGRNLASEYVAFDRPERLPELTAKLLRKKIDVFVTRSTPATLAAKNAAGNVPVVAAGVADPVETKLVQSMERPGGKVTGIGFMVKDVETKRMDVLRALAPGRKRLFALLDMGNPAIAETWKLTDDAARSLGLEPTLLDVRKADDPLKALQTAVSRGAEALVVRLGTLPDGKRRELVEEVARAKLPAIYASRLFVEAGGLVSYGVSSPYLYYRAAAFVDKLLKGAKPGELPMEKPDKFEFVVNRKALRALGLVLPPDLLLRSDDII